MHIEAIKNFARNITNICENITEPMADHDRKKKVVVKKVAFSLIDDNLDNYENKILNRLLEKQKWVKLYSEKYLDDKLQSLLSNILFEKKEDNEKDLYALSLSFFKELVEEYENFSQSFLVFVPLVGIKMKVDSLEIGNVVLRNMTEEFLKTLNQKLENIIMSTKNEEKTKLDFLKYNRDRLYKLNNTVCAEIEVVAEPIKAKQIAEEETSFVLDLLKYSVPAIYDENNISIGLQGEIGKTRLTPIIAKDESKFKFNSELVGFKKYFEISKDTIDEFKRIGVFELSELLKKPHKKLTNFEQVLLRGLHWFASSINQNEIGNKYLSLTVCLETFLTPNNTDPISNSLAEGIAFLIYEDFEDRKEIKSRVKELYNLRSRVFHGGNQDSIKEKDYKELQNLLGNLIMDLIDRKEKLETKEDLLELIEHKKLTN